MMWKKAFELLYIFFLQHEQFFTDWNALFLLNMNINYSSCFWTTHMGLSVVDWICSVIIKTRMEPGPWTLITYSAWCNNKPLSMICLVFTRASSVLIASVLHYWQTLLQAFLYVLKLPASKWRQQAYSWLHCIGRVCGQRGLEGTSIAHMQMILAWRHLSK